MPDCSSGVCRYEPLARWKKAALGVELGTSKPKSFTIESLSIQPVFVMECGLLSVVLQVSKSWLNTSADAVINSNINPDNINDIFFFIK